MVPMADDSGSPPVDLRLEALMGAVEDVREQMKESLTEVRQLVEQSREAVFRMENLLVRQRRWPVARWKQLFLAHPLMLPFAVRMLWGMEDALGVANRLLEPTVPAHGEAHGAARREDFAACMRGACSSS